MLNQIFKYELSLYFVDKKEVILQMICKYQSYGIPITYNTKFIYFALIILAISEKHIKLTVLKKELNIFLEIFFFQYSKTVQYITDGQYCTNTIYCLVFKTFCETKWMVITI